MTHGEDYTFSVQVSWNRVLRVCCVSLARMDFGQLPFWEGMMVLTDFG